MSAKILQFVRPGRLIFPGETYLVPEGWRLKLPDDGLAFTYGSMSEMAIAAREDPAHVHAFTFDAEQRGQRAMCLVCLRTVDLSKEPNK